MENIIEARHNYAARRSSSSFTCTPLTMLFSLYALVQYNCTPTCCWLSVTFILREGQREGTITADSGAAVDYKGPVHVTLSVRIGGCILPIVRRVSVGMLATRCTDCWGSIGLSETGV